MPPAPKPASPVLGPPLPGDLGSAMAKAQQPMKLRAAGNGVDSAQAERSAAEGAARSSVFFRRSSDNASGKRGAVAENAMPATAAHAS
jgi:hypothetical protein